MQVKVVRCFWTFDPMTMGGEIKGVRIRQNIYRDEEGVWEITQARPTGRRKITQYSIFFLNGKNTKSAWNRGLKATSGSLFSKKCHATDTRETRIGFLVSPLFLNHNKVVI